MKVNEFKCKNCGAIMEKAENANQVKCSYCNSVYDVQDAYSEAYKHHKGAADAATESFKEQFEMINNIFNNNPMAKLSRVFLIFLFVLIFIIFIFLIVSIVMDF